MTNIYWPVYKNLENELKDLTYAIHINDEQLLVYSSKITDLLLRACAEIESLSKELHKIDSAENTNIKFDEALKALNRKWCLDQKIVTISSYFCFQSQRELQPFEKKEKRSYSESNRLTYSWNNAYQNLKHDRQNSLEYGNLYYLFDALAALFLLNIYYKNEGYDLGNDSAGTSFKGNLGSNIFSVGIGRFSSHEHKNKKYIYGENIHQEVYIIRFTDRYLQNLERWLKNTNQKYAQILQENPMYKQYLIDNPNDKNPFNVPKILGSEGYSQLISSSMDGPHPEGEYLAVLNKLEKDQYYEEYV